MDNLNQCLFPQWQASQRKTSDKGAHNLFLHLGNLGTQQVLCVSPQSLTTLRDPMVCSPPGSSICGLLQARTLEWAASSFSRCSVYIYGLNSLPHVKRHFSKKHRWWGSGSYSQIEFLKIEMTLKSWLVRAFTMLWVNS